MVEAFDQFQQIEHLLQNLQMVNGADTWTYIWGTSIFSSKRAYRHLSGSSWSHPIFKWIWKSSCQHNHKVFFWPLSQDRLSTRNILKRKNFHLASFNCVLCAHNLEETVEHFVPWLWNGSRMLGLDWTHSKQPPEPLSEFWRFQNAAKCSLLYGNYHRYELEHMNN